jgi:hypothetical protein
MPRFKDFDWSVPKAADGTYTYDAIRVSLLMDIRDELKQLNTTLGCYRVRQMCDDVRRIDRRLREAGARLKGRGSKGAA